MATEVYELMMKLGLQNDARVGLTEIANILKNLSGYLTELENSLGSFTKAALSPQGLIGVSAAMLGVSGTMVWGMNKFADESAGAVEELNKMKLVLGEIGAEKLAGAARAVTGQVPGSSYAENLKLAGDLGNILGPGGVDNIVTLLPQLARAQEFLGLLGDKTAGSDITSLVQTLGRTGMTDPSQQAKLLAYIDNMVKTVQATGGAVTAQDYMKAIRFGGIESMGWSDDFVTNTGPERGH